MIYITLVGAFFVGYYLRDIRDKLLQLLARVGELKLAQDKSKPPSTGFAEPLTRAELAASLEDEKIRLLNE